MMHRHNTLYRKNEDTRLNVVPVPHDQLRFSQCKYQAPRTNILCKEIRSREQLARNRGICENHANLQAICAQQGQMEDAFVSTAIPQPSAHSIQLGNQVVDFPPFLREKPFWKDEIGDQSSSDVYTNKMIKANPFQRADILTEKERNRVLLLDSEMRLKKLLMALLSNEANARKRMRELGVGEEDSAHQSNYSSKRICFVSDNELAKNGENGDVKGNAWLDDAEHQCIFENVKDGVQQRCSQSRLPLEKYCLEHIRLSSSQQLFSGCRVCNATTFDVGDRENGPLCEQHEYCRTRRSISPGGSLREYRVPSGDTTLPSWKTDVGTGPVTEHRVTLTLEGEEEERSLKKEKTATTVDSMLKMQLNAVPKKSEVRPIKPAQPAVREDPGFMAAIMGMNSSFSVRRKRDDGLQSCARSRPFGMDELKAWREKRPGKTNLMPNDDRNLSEQSRKGEMSSMGRMGQGVMYSVKGARGRGGHPSHTMRPYNTGGVDRAEHEAFMRMCARKAPPPLRGVQQPRRPLGIPSRLSSAPRPSFPIGTAQSALQFARSLEDGFSSSSSMSGSRSPATTSSSSAPLAASSSLASSSSPSSHLPPLSSSLPWNGGKAAAASRSLSMPQPKLRPPQPSASLGSAILARGVDRKAPMMASPLSVVASSTSSTPQRPSTISTQSSWSFKPVGTPSTRALQQTAGRIGAEKGSVAQSSAVSSPSTIRSSSIPHVPPSAQPSRSSIHTNSIVSSSGGPPPTAIESAVPSLPQSPSASLLSLASCSTTTTTTTTTSSIASPPTLSSAHSIGPAAKQSTSSSSMQRSETSEKKATESRTDVVDPFSCQIEDIEEEEEEL